MLNNKGKWKLKAGIVLNVLMIKLNNSKIGKQEKQKCVQLKYLNNKKKKTQSKPPKQTRTCFNLSQFQFIASLMKEIIFLYISLHPNTKINFQKILTNFLFFSPVAIIENYHIKNCMSKAYVQQLLTLAACVAEEFLHLSCYNNFQSYLCTHIHTHPSEYKLLRCSLSQ